MRPLMLQQVAEWTNGRLINGSEDRCVHAVSTDTRVDLSGALFIPLKGEKFDAHSFASAAMTQGAAALLKSKSFAGDWPDVATVIVDDTLAALQSLAARYRQSLGIDRAEFLAVGVSGSNGKTSTKDFLSAVLAQRYCVNATKGNLNNHIGLPLTVLSTSQEHSCGVFEMGMNHPGELAPLAAISRPDISVITNVGTAHIEYMGSRQAIATEKGCLAWASQDVVLNADDEFTPYISARCRGVVATAGLKSGDISAEDIDGSTFTLKLNASAASWARMEVREVPITLGVPGRHMIQNALLAAAVGLMNGFDLFEVKVGLESAKLHGGRLERKNVSLLNFLDDSYNANPDSMRAALATLMSEKCSGRKIAVLGRMGELGIHSEAGHRYVGDTAKSMGLDYLITVGEDHSLLIHQAFDRSQDSTHFTTHQEAADWLKAHATPQDMILLKGSRSASMEKVIHALSSQQPSSAH